MFWKVKKDKSLAAFRDFKNNKYVKDYVNSFLAIAMKDFLSIADDFDGNVEYFIDAVYLLNRNSTLKRLKKSNSYMDKYFFKLMLLACRQCRMQMLEKYNKYKKVPIAQLAEATGLDPVSVGSNPTRDTKF